jgi:hypothetical protein
LSWGALLQVCSYLLPGVLEDTGFALVIMLMLAAGAGDASKPNGARRLVPVWCNTALMETYKISSVAAYSKTLQKLASRDPLLVYVLQKAVNALGNNRRPRPPTLHVTADPAASNPELLGLRITACWWQGAGDAMQYQAGGERSSVAGAARRTSGQNMQGHIVPALILQHGAEVRGHADGSCVGRLWMWS